MFRKEAENLPFVKTQMDPEGTMLREISQTLKKKNFILLTCGTQSIKTKAKFTDDRLLVARGCGEGWKVGKLVRKVNRYRLYFQV